MNSQRVPLRIIALLVIGAVTGVSLWIFWPRDPDVDGRTDIYELQVFVHDKYGNEDPNTGVSFLDLEPYKTKNGTGTFVLVAPEQANSASDANVETIELVVKVPVNLWGGRTKCDPRSKSAYCTEANGIWKKAVYTRTWSQATADEKRDDAVWIPPYEGVGYGVAQNSGHLVVSMPEIVLPAASSKFQPDVVLNMSNWRSYQWQGSAPDSSTYTGGDIDLPAFLLNGTVSGGIYLSPGFTTFAVNPSQAERDNQDLLLTGALLGVLGGVLVSLVAELMPRRVGKELPRRNDE